MDPTTPPTTDTSPSPMPRRTTDPATTAPAGDPPGPQRARRGPVGLAGALAVLVLAAGLLLPAAVATSSPGSPTGHGADAAASAQDPGADEIAFEVRAQKTEGKAEPQSSIDFPIVVENHGTVDTKFTFEVPEETGGFQVVNPEPLVLEAPTGDAPTTGEVRFTVYTPFRNGYVSETTNLTLTVTAHNASDESQTAPPKTLTFTASTEGFHIPGPGTMLAVGTLAGVAMLVDARPRSG